MKPLRIATLTTLSLLAFAGNSLLCRAALKSSAVAGSAQLTIDAASFTTIRLIAGAIVLWLLVMVLDSRTDARTHAPSIGMRAISRHGNWLSALALFTYAACFSYAYTQLSAAVGALLLFGAVQATMIGVGIYRGERLQLSQCIGLVVAISGLVGLMLPDASVLVAPPLQSAALMLLAGAAWGVYSLRGKAEGANKAATGATAATAGNFVRAVPFAVALSLLQLNTAVLAPMGMLYAVVSGAITSGLGYAIWYTVLPDIKATSAATLQLSVPVIAMLGGAALLNEAITLRAVLASIAILGGIGLVIFAKKRVRS